MILGVAYKRDIDDVRESPALDIIHLLGKRGAQGHLQRPVRAQAARRRRGSGAWNRWTPRKRRAEADCVVIVTDHKAFDYATMVERAQLIVDTRNALKGNRSEKIVRL